MTRANRLWLPALLSTALFSSTTAAQEARAAISLGPPSAQGPDLANTIDVTLALTVRNDGGREVLVSRSDGRGVEWSAPTRLDGDTSGATKRIFPATGGDWIAMAGLDAYAIWLDERNDGVPSTDVYLSRSTDGGGSWGSEVRLDKASSGGSTVQALAATIAVADDPSGDFVHVIIQTLVGSAVEVVLVSSSDGGQTFGAAVPLSTTFGTGPSATHFDLAVDGPVVHVAWSDDRAPSNDLRLFYRRSDDGGSTLGPEIALDSDDLFSFEELEVMSLDDRVVLGWTEIRFPGAIGKGEVRTSTSLDGGDSFLPSVRVGQYSTNDSARSGAFGLAGDRVIATWADRRLGPQHVFVATSADGGLTFSSDIDLGSTFGGSTNNKVVSAGDDVAIAYCNGSFPTITDQGYAAVSRDGGSSWEPPFRFTTSSDSLGVDVSDGVFDQLYGNFVLGWGLNPGANFEPTVGGFRPQTIRPRNFAPGGMANYRLSGFRGTEDLAWVWLSHTTGSLPIGFGAPRDMGIEPLSAFFNFSLQSPNLLLAALDSDGAGATVPVPYTLPPGISWVATAFSIQLVPTVEIVEITDVVPVNGG